MKMSKNEQRRDKMLLNKVEIVNKITVEEIRILSNYSQKEFSEKIGIPFGTYRKKARGEIGFWASEIAKISEQFNVPIEKIKV
nr:MAG TPA: Helix-turn-helix XRE-family like protein [Caudoviricetes sp.]